MRRRTTWYDCRGRMTEARYVTAAGTGRTGQNNSSVSICLAALQRSAPSVSEITAARRHGSRVVDVGADRLFGGLHLACRRNSRYDDQQIRRQATTARNASGGQIDEHDIFRPAEPPVRHRLPAGTRPPHLGRSHRRAQGRGRHDVGAVPVPAAFGQPDQPLGRHHGGPCQLLPHQAGVLHRRRVLREARQGTDVAGQHARRGHPPYCGAHRRAVPRGPAGPGRRRSTSCVAKSTWTISSPDRLRAARRIRRCSVRTPQHRPAVERSVLVGDREDPLAVRVRRRLA